MNFTVAIEKNFTNGDLTYLVTESDRIRLQAAMANRMGSIIFNNFGYDGEDRPKPWHELGSRYAKEFHGGDTTPTLELTCTLRDSVDIDDTNPEYASVFTENEYAAMHQWGIPGKLHARPFFPMTEDGQLTPYSEQAMLDAVEYELDRILAGK